MIPDDMLPPSYSSDEEMGDLVVNANRQQAVTYEESDDESDDDDNDETWHHGCTDRFYKDGAIKNKPSTEHISMCSTWYASAYILLKFELWEYLLNCEIINIHSMQHVCKLD